MRMPTVSRGRALAYLAVVLCLLALGGRVLLAGGARSGNGRTAEPLAALEIESSAAQTAEPELLVVHVVGAVRRPGLYRLEPGSRVADAIRRAGGAKPKAALALVNLAAPVADGQQIVVPARGRAAPQGTAPVAGAPTGPVHLNTATLEELDTLPGVGPVTAQRILDYRAKHGSFSSVDELDAIPGIGPARLEQLRELVAP